MTNVTQVEVGSVVVMLSYRRGDNRLALLLESTQKANPSLRSVENHPTALSFRTGPGICFFLRFSTKVDPSCRLPQALQLEIGTSLRFGMTSWALFH